MIIRTMILISHDATDPTANDTTLDLSDEIRQRLHRAFDFDDDEIEWLDDGFVIQADLDIDNVAKFHVEP